LLFFNSEGFDFNPIPLDLRGLEDLKGRSTFAVFSNSEGFEFPSLVFQPTRGIKEKSGPGKAEI
jgi:hypothetical protein